MNMTSPSTSAASETLTIAASRGPHGATARVDSFAYRYPATTVRIDGHPWSYRRTANGPTPLLLLPGAHGSTAAFFDLVARLPARDLIAVDPPYGMPPERLGLALGALLQHIGVESVLGFGVGVGGYLLQLLMRARPRLVTAALLVNSFSRGLSHYGAGEPIMDDDRTLFLHDRMAASRASGPTAGERTLAHAMPHLMGTYQTSAQYRDAQRLAYHGGPAWSDHMGKGRVAIVRCGDDYSMPARAAEDLRLAYPLASYFSLANGGPHPHISCPETLASLIWTWFDRPNEG